MKTIKLSVVLILMSFSLFLNVKSDFGDISSINLAELTNKAFADDESDDDEYGGDDFWGTGDCETILNDLVNDGAVDDANFSGDVRASCEGSDGTCIEGDVYYIMYPDYEVSVGGTSSSC